MGLVSYGTARTLEQKAFATGSTGKTLNASTTRISFPFAAPITGNVDRIGIATGTVTSSQSITVGIYDTDGSGNPGSIVGAAGTQGTIASNTGYEISLGTDAALTHGTQYFVVVEWTSTTGTAVFRTYAVTGIGDTGSYTGTYASSTWTRNASERLACWLVFDDALVYPINSSPFTAVSGATSLTTGTTPDEYGNRFQFPYPVRLHCVEILINLGASADLDIVVYSGVTAITTHSRLAVYASATGGGQRWFTVHLPADSDFDVNEEFFIVVKATTANSSTYIKWSVASNAVLGGLPSGVNCYAVSRSDAAGSWTTDTAAVHAIIPVFSAFSNGGMLIHSGMTGGISA